MFPMASKLSTFFAELKRRKVYHVAVAYVVGGAGTIEAASNVLGSAEWEQLRLPIVVLVLVGFPLALVLAWAYEVKPEEPRVADTPEEEETHAHETPESGLGHLKEGRKSIVVLPFDNMSPDPSDAYFSDGLTEEIITDLSHLHSLRVISRNSAMVLKGTQKDTRTIAQELGVQYVLEGSVRKAGADLRITAQLIDAPSDTHIWAEKYDGELEDVFGMQEQVSRSIVDALRVALDPSEEARLASRPVDDLVAYECYLRARHYIWNFTEESLEEALALLTRGLELQPKSAELHATRAIVNCQYINGMTRAALSYPELLEEAQGWASRALELDPGSSMAHFSQGWVDWFSGRPAGGMTHFTRALELNPNDADTLNFLGFGLVIGGHHLEKAREFLERAAEVDPLNPLNSEVGLSYFSWFTGDFEGVLGFWKTWRHAKAPLLRLYTGYFHAANGDVEEGIELFSRIAQEKPEHPAATAGTFLRHALRGEREEALATVNTDLEEVAWWDEFTPVLMADGDALVGENERALHWVDRAIEMGMCDPVFLGEHEPFLRRLRGDPGFDSLLEKARTVSTDLAAHAETFWGP
jgi:TolB-like protein